MTTRKLGRTILVAALALSMVLSITGGTIAWFTDEVISENNVIQAGTLDVKLYYSDDAAAWTDIEDENAEKALFNYDKWEPGYTAVKYVKIENAGNLAFNYQFDVNASSIVAEGNANLAEVIDVYVADASAGKLDKAAALANKVASLEELKGDKLFKAGTLEAKAEGATENPSVVLCLALHMQEEAGNEYQNCSLSNIAIKLVATQATVEEDAFGSDYDEDAEYDAITDPNVRALKGDELKIICATEVSGVKVENVIDFPVLGGEQKLDFGLEFTAEGFNPDFDGKDVSGWFVDFELESTKGLSKEDAESHIALAGHYAFFDLAETGEWIGFEIKGVDVPENAPQRIVGIYDPNLTFTEVEAIGTFKCGVIVDKDYFAGETLTLTLCMYEPNDDGEPIKHIIRTVKKSF